MDANTKTLILAHTQAVSRFYQALRTSEAKLVELVRHSIGAGAPDPEVVASFLRRAETRTILERDWECSLWASADPAKSTRLVCLAVTTNLTDAAARIAKRPAAPDSTCFWCWQTERGSDREQLVLEKDLYGEATGALLHKQCLRPWMITRQLAMRGGQQ